MAAPALISTAEVGEIMHVSEQAVRTWCRLGVLPATRPAGTRKWLIARADFESWLHEGTGERVAIFLDGARRSESTEDELLADTAPPRTRASSRAVGKRKGADHAGPARRPPG